jgi:hypothetical protein
MCHNKFVLSIKNISIIQKKDETCLFHCQIIYKVMGIWKKGALGETTQPQARLPS